MHWSYVFLALTPDPGLTHTSDEKVSEPLCSSCRYISGLVQERHNSIANALELHLSCTNPWICAEPGCCTLCVNIASGNTWMSRFDYWSFQLLKMSNEQFYNSVCTINHSMAGFIPLTVWFSFTILMHYFPGIILGMGSANQRWHYNITLSLIWWAQRQNYPCFH